MWRTIVLLAFVLGGWFESMGSTGTTALGQDVCTVEGARQVASDVGYGDTFGSSVAIDGDTFVVGSAAHDDGAQDAGAAYVFRYDGNTWVEEQKLTASDGAYFDSFGSSVSVDGNVVAVGAPMHDAGAWGAGAAYVYRYDGSKWVEEHKLTASDAAYADRFGASVSVDGDVVVAGAPSHNAGAWLTGAAYVFRYEGSTWVEEQKLTASDGAFGDYLGWSVAVDGDVVAAGAPSHDDAGGAGAAYVFRYDGSSWMEEQELLAFDGAYADWFGASVSVDSNVVVVGTPNEDAGAGDTGAAYVFRYEGSTWVEEQRLTASDAAYANVLGWSVSVDSNVVVVGAPSWFDGWGWQAGAAYVFRYDGSRWMEEQKLTATDGAYGDEFGWSISVDSDVVVVGARFSDSVAQFGGAAYTFTISSINCGDYDGNGVVDLNDYTARIGCADGPGKGGNTNACNGAFDSDNDGDIDLKDFAWFSRLFSP